MLDTPDREMDDHALRRSVHLLIIDDDSVDRQQYRRFLELSGRDRYEVFEAHTADEAATQLFRARYDCIVLDYRLPGADGLWVLEAIRQWAHANRTVPVIMMTGQGSEDVVVRAMKMGISDYLRKEKLTAPAFGRAVNNAIEKARLQDEVREKTQRLELVNAELKRKAAEVRSFYHNVSHELKTPLSAVREFIALVHDGVAGPLSTPEQPEYLRYALEGCDRLARQMGDLLDAARLEMDKMALKLAPTAVDRMIRFAVASVAQSAGEKSLVITTTLAANLVPVLADEDRLVQVLGNLLHNAVKFTDRGGQIDVSAYPSTLEPDRLIIEVEDNGRGIDEQHLERIFDRLYQAHDANAADAGGGLGLGLSIARDIVERHGGRLAVHSTPGLGTAFRIALPRAGEARRAVA